MIENYGGGPVGIKTIAANVGEDTDTIEEVYEPYFCLLYTSPSPRDCS